jgi:phage gpG-like protein
VIITLSRWKNFKAFKDKDAIRRFLFNVADESFKAFKSGILSSKHGRIYQRQGRTHRASAPGEYPARDSGALLASLDTHVTDTQATIGTNMFYSIFLREGTSRMARRRMSDDALLAGMQRGGFGEDHFAKWKR